MQAWRGKDNISEIAEEIADVEMMLDQLKLMLDIAYDVQELRNKKLARLDQILMRGGS